MTQGQGSTPSSRAMTSTGSADVTARTPNSSGIAGTTLIDDSVIARIAGLAAREVPGVHEMSATGAGQTALGSLSGFTSRFTGQSNDAAAKGVSVEVSDTECIVALNFVVEYGANIPQVADTLRRAVSSRLQATTGLVTKEVNINVTDLYMPQQDQQQ